MSEPSGMTPAPFVTAFREWVLHKANCVFAYLVYKKMFTPYEQEQKFMDESEFTDIYLQKARIVEAVALGAGDWLLGLQNLYDDGYESAEVEYYRLSEIRLYMHEAWQHAKEEENDDDETENH